MNNQAKIQTNILDIPMQENDANAKTIREYLKALLEKLWSKGEGFCGKRPFGNSDWEYDLYIALVAAGAVEGTLDEDGCFEDCDTKKADSLIFQAIQELN